MSQRQKQMQQQQILRDDKQKDTQRHRQRQRPEQRQHSDGNRFFSGADEAGVEGAGEGDVGGALDEGAAVGEESEGVGWAFEAEEKIVEADGAVGKEAV